VHQQDAKREGLAREKTEMSEEKEDEDSGVKGGDKVV